MAAFENLIFTLSNELWSKWVLIFLIGTGIVTLFATNGVQSHLGLALKRTFKSWFKKDEGAIEGAEGNISPVKSLMNALASTTVTSCALFRDGKRSLTTNRKATGTFLFITGKRNI